MAMSYLRAWKLVDGRPETFLSGADPWRHGAPLRRARRRTRLAADQRLPDAGERYLSTVLFEGVGG